AVLPNVLDIRFAFSRTVVGDDALSRIGVSQQERSKAGWNVLGYLGFTDQEIEEANAVICGTQTVEGAPGLKDEHLAVFDCANRCVASACRGAATGSHRRRGSPVTRCSSAPASTRTVSWARSSSTCTRRARRSAA